MVDTNYRITGEVCRGSIKKSSSKTGLPKSTRNTLELCQGICKRRENEDKGDDKWEIAHKTRQDEYCCFHLA